MSSSSDTTMTVEMPAESAPSVDERFVIETTQCFRWDAQPHHHSGININIHAI